MTTHKKLAYVCKASLEIQERGILTFWINVDYEEGSSQTVGGFALDSYDKQRQERVGTAYGCEMIRKILTEFGVNDFSEIAHKHIWVLGTGEGLEFKPLGLQALQEPNKLSEGFLFNDIAKQFFD